MCLLLYNATSGGSHPYLERATAFVGCSIAHLKIPDVGGHFWVIFTYNRNARLTIMRNNFGFPYHDFGVYDFKISQTSISG
jgi:hypothetical protein